MSRGGVEPFDGDLDDYQRYLLDEAKRVRETMREAGREARATETPAPALASSAPPQPQAAPNAQSKKNVTRSKTLRREQGKLEQQILDLQASKHSLEARLSETVAPEQLANIGLDIEKVSAQLDALEENWLLLSEEIEALERNG